MGTVLAVEAESATRGFNDEQRLAFGRAAELYDEIRPGYPPEVLDALIAAAGLVSGDRVYEVGAGTGKGTVELARRGLEVLAVEPDPDMARIARRHVSSLRGVSLIQIGFEDWGEVAPRKALVSFQAWHWTRPELRYRIAHQVVSPGGTLAAVWSFPDWDRCPLRQRLAAAYRSAAPEMVSDFPMHPASHPTALAGDWRRETTEARLFESPLIHRCVWDKRYTAAEYVGLLQTHQDHMLLPDDQRRRLLGEIHTAINMCGGSINLPLASYVCTATRSGGAERPNRASDIAHSLNVVISMQGAGFAMQPAGDRSVTRKAAVGGMPRSSRGGR